MSHLGQRDILCDTKIVQKYVVWFSRTFCREKRIVQKYVWISRTFCREIKTLQKYVKFGSEGHSVEKNCAKICCLV